MHVGRATEESGRFSSESVCVVSLSLSHWGDLEIWSLSIGQFLCSLRMHAPSRLAMDEEEIRGFVVKRPPFVCRCRGQANRSPCLRHHRTSLFGGLNRGSFSGLAQAYSGQTGNGTVRKRIALACLRICISAENLVLVIADPVPIDDRSSSIFAT